MRNNTIESMVIKLEGYIKRAENNVKYLALVLPVLVQWEGKKITKRLQTKLNKELPELRLYLNYQYGSHRLTIYHDHGTNDPITFYLSRNSDVFNTKEFEKENVSMYHEKDRLKEYIKARNEIKQWSARYGEIVTQLCELKNDMKPFGCEYLIEWEELRYVS